MDHVVLRNVESVPWRNGGGTTSVLWVTGDSPTGPRLRVSVAHISVDGPFSHYPGVTRYQRVLHGAGFRLTGDRSLHVDHTLVRYAGGLRLHCSLLQGPVDVVNVMVAAGVDAVVREVGPGTRVTGCVVLLDAAGSFAAGDLVRVEVPWRTPGRALVLRDVSPAR